MQCCVLLLRTTMTPYVQNSLNPTILATVIKMIQNLIRSLWGQKNPKLTGVRNFSKVLMHLVRGTNKRV